MSIIIKYDVLYIIYYLPDDKLMYITRKEVYRLNYK